MQLNGVPNDIIQNLNPISIVIMIPIMDFLVYPALRNANIRFTPLKRIFAGFMFASAAMISACVIQVYIYKLGPCGKYASECDEPAPLNVWIQSLPYILIGISEIFASITSLEYAFSKAPSNMRSLVMAVNLAMSAVSSALAQALVGLSADPLLVWNYAVAAILAFLGGAAFWYCFAQLDRDEDKWNMIQETSFKGKNPGNVSIEPLTEKRMDSQ